MNRQSLREGIAVNAIATVLGIVYLLTGGVKLAGLDVMVESFRGWGYSIGFMYLIGILEVVGALMILMPRSRFYGAGLLSVLMIGAAFTHASAGEWLMLPGPIVMLLLTGTVAWTERSVRGPRERHA